jgi:hypothetical protein
MPSARVLLTPQLQQEDRNDRNCKEAKAPAKPKKAATMYAEETKMADSSHAQIAQLAQKFWAARGWQNGYAEQDWLVLNKFRVSPLEQNFKDHTGAPVIRCGLLAFLLSSENLSSAQ